MSSTASAVRQGSQDRVGVIGKLFTFISNLFVVLLLAMISSIIIEYIGMAFWWDEPGAGHSQLMLQNEIAYIGADLRQSLYGPAPEEIATNVAAAVREKITINTGLSKYLSNDANYMSTTRLGSMLNTSGNVITDYVEAAINVVQVFAIRCMVIGLSAPLFILLVFVASIDGLVQRELRKAGGGREYGFLYHNLKSKFKWMLFLPLFIYLASPFATHPNYIILPGSICIAVLCFFISATFKKYL